MIPDEPELPDMEDLTDAEIAAIALMREECPPMPGKVEIRAADGVGMYTKTVHYDPVGSGRQVVGVSREPTEG